MFNRNRILVTGSGGVASRILEELVSSGRQVRQVGDLDRAASLLHSAQTLIVADPTDDPDALVRKVSGICRSGSARRLPLRMILVHRQAGVATMPAFPEGTELIVETFDPEAEAARALLSRWPPHAGMDPPYAQVPHILFAGFAAPAPALLVQTLRLIHYGDALPVVTLADADPQARRDWMLEAYPQAGQFCRLRFADISDSDLRDVPPVTGAFVCTESAELGLATARHLIAQIARDQRASPPVYLEVGDSPTAGEAGEWDGQIFPFSWLHEACKPEILLDGRGDELARVVHEHYRDSIAAQGRDPGEEPAGRAWEQLKASYRDASRHQADHLHAKLATLDCRAVREELVESFTFAPLEAERLAVIEHERWAADRYLDGWTYAPERDNARKHHPQLIPYDELNEPMKDLDRFAVRLAPTLLARSGRGLVRMLLVAVPEPPNRCRTGRRLRHLAERALRRLIRRYPDRSMVLASTLESDATRLVVRLALNNLEAGLFLLCPRPLPETLAVRSGERGRVEFLELAAHAERRINLNGDKGVDDWVARRTEIRLLVGPEDGDAKPEKRIRIDSAANRLDWNFEY